MPAQRAAAAWRASATPRCHSAIGIQMAVPPRISAESYMMILDRVLDRDKRSGCARIMDGQRLGGQALALGDRVLLKGVAHRWNRAG